MKPDERDLAYLWDMLDAAQRIERLTEGLDYAAFVDDALQRLGLAEVFDEALGLDHKLVRCHTTSVAESADTSVTSA